MLQAQVFLWAYILLFFPASIVAQGLGVNWGVIASHPLDPKIVVNMLKDNGIKKVKLFHAEHDILTALSGTDIEVMVRIPNHSLESLSEKYSVAQAWVKANITAYMGKKGVNFKYVAVGNEPFLAAYNGTYNDLTLPAMKNILKALNEAGVGKDIKVSTPLNGDVYITPTYKPSDGIFRHDLADIMNGICEFLHKNNAAFIVNIYPFLNLYQNPGFPEPYAFFDNDDSNSMDDHGVKYCSRMAKNEGTPLRLKQYPDVYIFSLLDEDIKSIDPGMFERHWGIFSFDGQPKFPMDLSGKGQNKPLVGGKNVTYMEKKWCVYNKDASNQKDLLVKVAWACNNTDCTTLVPGASCSGMGIDMNASVAFNMYYQMANQTKGACDFDGLAKIVKRDPSNGTCRFPIMIKTIQTTSNSTASAPKSSRSSTFSSSTSHSPFETHSPSPSSSPFHSPLLIFQIFVGIFTIWFV
ncbi:hypothetical protein E1A91_A10G092000v1 [Gossypium mustelinum]|uniref:glucan endo-1,3-beta-D-glucosidase n=1 Tax=Gossypium mustelinum TaxID=34275 RepID=A0A5D2XJA9_GOSMU|nr:hypothetical protein E1A91_A10G092000v1 [Gossypium mustelinum]